MAVLMNNIHNRSIVSIPENLEHSIVNLPIWLEYFTTQNNAFKDQLQNFEIIVCDDSSHEYCENNCIENHYSIHRFVGKLIYADLKSDHLNHYGFAIYAVYEKDQISGYRTLMIKQDISKLTNVGSETAGHFKTLESILVEVLPNEVDLARLIPFIMPSTKDLTSLEDLYKHVAKYYLTTKDGQQYTTISKGHAKKNGNKTVYCSFLGLIITFDLEKASNNPVLLSILVQPRRCGDHVNWLTNNDVIDILFSKGKFNV